MRYPAIMKLTLTADGPLLVSSGSANRLHPELPDYTFMTSRVNGTDTYVIPGSALKGTVKHYLYRTCESDALIEALFKSDQKPLKKSRISFQDAFADMDTVETAVRHSTAIGSVSQGPQHGTLNNLIAVIAGVFSTCIRMRDASVQEIKMILQALQAVNRHDICFGGRVSRGFGRMHIGRFSMTVSDGYDAFLRPNIAGQYDTLSAAEEAYSSAVLQTEGAAEWNRK